VYVEAWRPVATIRPSISVSGGFDLFAIHTDHLGTSRRILDSNNGSLRWAWDAVEPFGHQMANSNPSGLGVFVFHHRFPGQYLDETTGLLHNWHRDYHSGLGRYVQSDPLGLIDGWSTYAYVGGNPMGLIDPEGLRGVRPTPQFRNSSPYYSYQNQQWTPVARPPGPQLMPVVPYRNDYWRRAGFGMWNRYIKKTNNDILKENMMYLYSLYEEKKSNCAVEICSNGGLNSCPASNSISNTHWPTMSAVGDNPRNCFCLERVK